MRGDWGCSCLCLDIDRRGKKAEQATNSALFTHLIRKY